jgi:hypothetical protein
MVKKWSRKVLRREDRFFSSFKKILEKKKKKKMLKNKNKIQGNKMTSQEKFLRKMLSNKFKKVLNKMLNKKTLKKKTALLRENSCQISSMGLKQRLINGLRLLMKSQLKFH